MLSVGMLSDIILSVVMLNAIKLDFYMLSVSKAANTDRTSITLQERFITLITGQSKI